MTAFSQAQEQPWGDHGEERARSNVEFSVPPESLKYQHMTRTEVIVDPSRYSRESHAITADFETVVYKSHYDGKNITVFDRKTGEVRTLELPEMVANVRLSSDETTLFFDSDGDFYVFDLKSLTEKKVFKNVRPKFGSPNTNRLNKGVCVIECKNGLLGFNLLEEGEPVLLLDPIKELGGPTDSIRFFRGSDRVFTLIGSGRRVLVYDLKSNESKVIYEDVSREGSVHAISESRDGTHFYIGEFGKIRILSKDGLSQDGEIKVSQMYEDKGEYREASEQILQIEESLDSTHLIVRATNSIMIINLKTDQEVKRIPGGRQFFQSPETGDLSVNTDQGIELWSFNQDNSLGTKMVHVKDGELLGDPEWYGRDSVIKDKTREGTFWVFIKNHEVPILESQGGFKWGKQRIYFDIPLDQLEKMADLVDRAAVKAKVAISYKYVDTDLNKNSQKTLDRKVTRFVTNFATVEDARNFYKALNDDPGYQGVPADPIPEDFAYPLDQKAFYAQDPKEYRQLDVREVLEALAGFALDPDGNYSRPNQEGGIETISEKEYRDRLAKADVSSLMKRAWEQNST